MTEELGEETTRAVASYQGVTALTEKEAKYIVTTLWPLAPDVERMKAAMICHQYKLNPLAKHVFLIPFKNKATGATDWAMVMGIGATRLIASRKSGGYGYIDGPRIMTEDEQRNIRGEIDRSNFWAITKLRDQHGNEAVGYGCYPRHENPKGVEKGNTRQNMAFIRSERNAFDRLIPGEMPSGVDVVDTDYEGNVPQIRDVTPPVQEDTGEIIEEGASIKPPEAEPPVISPTASTSNDNLPEIQVTFAHRGEFMQWWKDKHKLSPADIMLFADVTKVEDINYVTLHPQMLKVYEPQ